MGSEMCIRDSIPVLRVKFHKLLVTIVLLKVDSAAFQDLVVFFMVVGLHSSTENTELKVVGMVPDGFSHVVHESSLTDKVDVLVNTLNALLAPIHKLSHVESLFRVRLVYHMDLQDALLAHLAEDLEVLLAQGSFSSRL